MTNRTNTFMRALLASAALAAPAFAHGEEQGGDAKALPTVKVEDTVLGAGDSPYAIAAPVSVVTREQLDTYADPKDALRSIPGVFLADVASQPGLQVNIRGMEGFGRVNTMIDGARQTFRIAGHEGGEFAYVDADLLAGIDVQRGAVSTAGGAGALAGAVNFRTLGVDDLVKADRTWGGRGVVRYGDNGMNWSGSVAAGFRPNDQIGFAAAYSGRDSRNYKNGDGDSVADTFLDTRSGLLKTTITPTADQRLDLGAKWYVAEFSSNYYDQTMQTGGYTANYSYKPAGDLIDLHVNASYGDTRMKWHDRNYGGGGVGPSSGRKIVDKGVGFDTSNVSRFAFDDIALKLEYGGEFFRNEVTARNGGVNPEGQLTLWGLFAEGTATRGRFGAVAALRYDHFELDGQGVAPPTSAPVPVIGSLVPIDTSGGKVSPKLTLTAQATDWLQLYVTYAMTYRAPTTAEALYSGAHAGSATANWYPNPFLRAERGKGWEFGANVYKDGVWRSGDKLRAKIDYFYTDVDDFINQNCVAAVAPERGSKCFYANIPGVSTLKGIEVEGRYDAGFAYAALTYQDTDIDYASGAAANYLPRDAMTLEGGVRPLGRKLELGARLRAVGKTQTSLTGDSTPSYVTADLFGSYRLANRYKLFVNATNIADKEYTPALGTAASGRGRTVVVGVMAQF